MERTHKIAIGLVVLLVVVGGGGVAATQTEPPTVETVESEWGTISEDSSEIITQIVVENPNPIGLPVGNLDITYVVLMNDIQVAEGAIENAKLGPGTNTLEGTAAIDNSKIPDWWVTHINNGEQTSIVIRPDVTVDLPVTEFAIAVPEQRDTVTTDLLESFSSADEQRIERAGQTILVVKETRGQWGTADAEQTPLGVSATVENPNPIPIVFTKISYTVTMNDVTVANGTSTQSIRIPPESTKTIRTDALLETPTLADWWVSHLRNDETTELSVDFYATVEVQGQQRTIPIKFYTITDTFETDILGE